MALRPVALVPVTAYDPSRPTPAAIVSGESTLQLLQRLYLQNLQASSCTTNSPNVQCPPPPRMG